MSALRKYKFLLKPVFFIFNLLFSTWLVIQIEQISPSDFGRYRHLFEPKPQLPSLTRQQELKKLCNDYKSGLLDSTQLELEILDLMDQPN
jgi:hypothetical protein